MNTERIKQKLNSETSKLSVNDNTYLTINLDNEHRILPSGQINEVVNVAERFNIPVYHMEAGNRCNDLKVPVEKIITITNDFEPVIKEVIIEKIVEVENTDKLKMLSETLLKLRKDLSLKDKRIEELESINKQLESIKVSQGAVYLKGSNITQRL